MIIPMHFPQGHQAQIGRTPYVAQIAKVTHEAQATCHLPSKESKLHSPSTENQSPRTERETQCPGSEQDPTHLAKIATHTQLEPRKSSLNKKLYRYCTSTISIPRIG